jgi:hypothetical protein
VRRKHKGLSRPHRSEGFVSRAPGENHVANRDEAPAGLAFFGMRRVGERAVPAGSLVDYISAILAA